MAAAGYIKWENYVYKRVGTEKEAGLEASCHSLVATEDLMHHGLVVKKGERIPNRPFFAPQIKEIKVLLPEPSTEEIENALLARGVAERVEESE